MLYSSWRARIGRSSNAAVAVAPVTIVGAGFAGTMVAAQLARMQINSFLVEECAHREGAGAAYSTEDPSHLLNARAEAMSAWPDEPGDFAAEWRDYGRSEDAFAPRFVYRRYLQNILSKAVETGHVRIIRAAATAARKRRDVWSVQLADGAALESQHLVLSTGNEAPRRPWWSEQVTRNFVADPWSLEARQAIAKAAIGNLDVLIVGTGLTMIDVALSLQAAGHGGRIVAISRNGFVPHGHTSGRSQSNPQMPAAGTLRQVIRQLRLNAAEGDWRSTIDSLRPNVQEVWRQFSLKEKQRFLRHARPLWEVHRHRVAPAIAARIDNMREVGHLQVLAGRVLKAEAEDAHATVSIQLPGTGHCIENRFDVVFNCAGPLCNLLETRNPILDQLLREREIQPDELGIGLVVDSASRAKGHTNLWATGWLTKGTFLEITAVPEIREQAAKIASSIASELGVPRHTAGGPMLSTGLAPSRSEALWSLS
jgi:uncharacterized NAD(P)/FAD-binding protein YdhS